MESKKEKFYLLTLNTCLRNAEQFIKDALILKEKKSFGHAYSLGVLGFEELAKAWVFYDLFIGLVEEEDKTLSYLTTKHVFKQMKGVHTLSSIILLEWFKVSEFRNEIIGIFEELNKGNISFESYAESFYRIVLKDIQNSEIGTTIVELFKELEEIDKDNKIIDKRKQSGFYVDFDIKRDKILSTPESFNEEKTMNIETYEIFMQYSKDYFDEFQKNLDEKSVKKELENVRESMKYIRSFFSNQLEE